MRDEVSTYEAAIFLSSAKQQIYRIGNVKFEISANLTATPEPFGCNHGRV